MRIIINECKKILDIRIILLLCMFSILYYMTFTQIYRYPTGGQVTNTKYDIPFTAELVKEWGPKWKVKDEKQYQEKHQELEKDFTKIIKQDQELSKRGIVDYEIRWRLSPVWMRRSIWFLSMPTNACIPSIMIWYSRWSVRAA